MANIRGYLDVIKDIEIYLKNPKDKESIRNIKKTIKLLNSSSLKNYSSVYDYILSSGVKRNLPISYHQEQRNIYRLVRK